MKKSFFVVLMVLVTLFAFISCELAPTPDAGADDTETVDPTPPKPDTPDPKPDTPDPKPDTPDPEPEKPAEPKDPEITVTTERFITGTDLPALTKTTVVEGEIAWDEGQTVEDGKKEYKWTFTPTDATKWNKKTGTAIVIKVDEIIKDETFTDVDAEAARWEKDKSYGYQNCTFEEKLISYQQCSLYFENCEFNSAEIGSAGYKCIYLTRPTNLYINDSRFLGKVTSGTQSSAGYALDLNLFKQTAEDKLINRIDITNNTFSVTGEGANDTNVAISIKLRKGDTDEEFDEMGKLENSPMLIEDQVFISGNTFEEKCNKIYMGTNSTVDAAVESKINSSTGAFKMVLDNNNGEVNVYERYKTKVGVDKHTDKTTVGDKEHKEFDGRI